MSGCPPAGGAGPEPAPLPLLSLGLGALAVALHFAPEAAGVLAFERDALARGELWRLLTCHWVHWSADQMVWDTGTFVALGIACELRSRGRLALCVGAAALTISAAVWWILPGLGYYGGLSGIDCALWALLGTELWRERCAARRRTAVLVSALGVALVLKLGFEGLTHTTFFVAELGPGVRCVPEVHAAGAAVGLAVPLIAALAPRSRP